MKKTKHVALLRGINVGGNNKISMSELKACFEQLGFSEVVTYINSGNIIFKADKPEPELVGIIEQCIKDNFGLDIPVVVRSAQQITDVVKKLPDSWLNNKEVRTDVLFLWQEVDRPDVVNEIRVNPDVDELLYVPGALIWHVRDRSQINKSKMNYFIGTMVYKLMTARNANTTRKLHELMS